ncbi:photosystem II protein K plastid [Cinnamomum micranthum f. kanehirae]|uniref:Photosystem II protein K plastid n=1 Tax=Cinnamomum micranthum f. kanehirae TaxID=337451 RepID=A0A3S3RCU5_9MAGN|nr:photosystem II protein K plastid [Cinnamomum micranthum f. kanehirae]
MNSHWLNRLICLNSALHSSSFFFAKLPEAYAFFNPIVRCYASHTCALFSLSPCLASCCKFSMRSLILS